jgi:hypothetical protein
MSGRGVLTPGDRNKRNRHICHIVLSSSRTSTLLLTLYLGPVIRPIRVVAGDLLQPSLKTRPAARRLGLFVGDGDGQQFRQPLVVARSLAAIRACLQMRVNLLRPCAVGCVRVSFEQTLSNIIAQHGKPPPFTHSHRPAADLVLTRANTAVILLPFNKIAPDPFSESVSLPIKERAPADSDDTESDDKRKWSPFVPDDAHQRNRDDNY